MKRSVGKFSLLLAVLCVCSKGNTSLAQTGFNRQRRGLSYEFPKPAQIGQMVINIPESGHISNYSRVCDYRTGEIIVKQLFYRISPYI